MTADCKSDSCTQCQYCRGYIGDLLSTDYYNILCLNVPGSLSMHAKVIEKTPPHISILVLFFSILLLIWFENNFILRAGGAALVDFTSLSQKKL